MTLTQMEREEQFVIALENIRIHWEFALKAGRGRLDSDDEDVVELDRASLKPGFDKALGRLRHIYREATR